MLTYLSRRAAAMALLCLTLAPAQVRLAFDAASVRRAKGQDSVEADCRGIDSKYPPGIPVPPLGRCVMGNARLDHVIALAYELRFTESIKGGPAWARDDNVRFNIQATAPNPDKATHAELLQMMQTLLQERFKAKLRLETQDIPGYALVVANGGPRVHESAESEAISLHIVPGPPATLTAHKYIMQLLAAFLELKYKEPVSNQTGLNGAYDFSLSWDNTAGPMPAAALKELGLKLERRKVPAPFVVIGSVEMPSEN